ncbi:MAG: DUF1801 domain-containing protein [Spirochaetales bacterium]|nr:DUF1801 domain-containing protein [Spirochaetales bacterium]
MNKSDEVKKYIESAPEQFKTILNELRIIVFETIENTSESMKWGFIVLGNPKDFAYLRYNKNHITFGFYNFQKITLDIDKLEGSGKTMRHVKIRKKEDIKKEIIKKWLLEIIK